MKALPALIRSLTVASLLSFAAPWLVVGVGFASLWLVGCVPPFGEIARLAIAGLDAILRVLGEGRPVFGLMTIALTFAFVGGLFETFAFYWDGACRRN